MEANTDGLCGAGMVVMPHSTQLHQRLEETLSQEVFGIRGTFKIAKLCEPDDPLQRRWALSSQIKG